MKEHDPLYISCFLNRVAAHCGGNPFKANLVKVLKEFFEFAEAKEHIKAFDAFCIAALKNEYSWENGCPANGLFYGERLELLIEAAYLIHQKAGNYHLKTHVASTISITAFPMPLSTTEYRNPLGFIEAFFGYASLPRWKKMLNSFTAAAISNGSVAEEIEAADIFYFSNLLQKLVYAANRLAAMAETEDSGTDLE